MIEQIKKGPSFLEGKFAEGKIVEDYRWEAKVFLHNDTDKFRIKYFGDLENGLIIQKGDIPQLVIAEDIINKREVLLFDGGKHGYDAMFVYEQDWEVLKGRTPDKFFTIKGEDIFEIQVSAQYGIDYDSADEDFVDEVDENGLIELVNCEKIPFEVAKRNGFDYYEINLITREGKKIEILSEELA